MTSHPLSRADRRRATEARILDSARELFAAKGFDRTTIRAVASSAGVDPALVMQYFDSKRGLFTRAVQAPPAAQASVDGDALLGHLMATLGVKLGGMPDGTLAMLRSMLTDPASAEHARATLDRQITAIGDALSTDDGGGEYGDGSDAELCAALIVTTMVGVTIGHQLLGLAALRDVPADRVTALLRPALDALTRPAG
ncbi:TetR/AcrR family transcriptional regulator [Streptomyces sp. NBC_01257]|uniref:TetR/AcrR family transcriptional regulator n=1 Tax=Streptomyces sp. NBC_01257 TaxID=2903799 RepID=UPI002DD93237|nr:TetR family transcriptional regulator [Streptomyces sp. NBC_01257]WRZ63564.1 TetR family transcriptional regulator [Streptomyces sp. NBC_01257]